MLTRTDYLSLPAWLSALFGILQALLLTRHMLFVGYSLKDDSFHKVMHEIRLARGSVNGVRTSRAADLGTASLLDQAPLLAELLEDELAVESCCPADGVCPADWTSRQRVRWLELFLDRVALLACDVSPFLLDPTYRSMLDDGEARTGRPCGRCP